MSIDNISDSKYLLVFSDDYSGFIVIFTSENKRASTILECFKIFKKQSELATSHVIKCVRSDNGTEFREVHLFLEENGIRIETSIAHNLEQNSRAERANRSTIEKLRSIMHGEHIPLFL